MRKYLVLRGGSYFNDSWYLRSTLHYWDGPEFRCRFFGFRIVVVQRKP
jgi:formylglycine-generating enzyme required for sulfatase activity